jgi:uncharacterized protein YlxW (UPF0749 family)
MSDAETQSQPDLQSRRYAGAQRALSLALQELTEVRAENARLLDEVARLQGIVGNVRRCVNCKREVLEDRSDRFRVVGTEGEGTEDGEEDWDI